MASSPAAAATAAPDGATAKSRPLLLVVAVVLLNDEGQVLLAQRPPGKALAGLWEYPGEEPGWEHPARPRPCMNLALHARPRPATPDAAPHLAAQPLPLLRTPPTHTLPGGKVDPGETPEAALVRELREELAIQVASASLRPLTFASHPYDAFHLLMPTYVASEWEGQPLGAEGQALAWVGARELEGGAYPMPPADLPMLAPVLAAMRQHREARQNAA